MPTVFRNSLLQSTVHGEHDAIMDSQPLDSVGNHTAVLRILVEDEEKSEGMKKKTVSGTMLTLLLIGMLTLAFNIQLAKASGRIDYIRSIAVTSGVIVFIFAVLELRNVVKQRQTDLIMRLEELKEQLGRGVITQEEYENLLSALSNVSTGIIAKEEYEQKKKKLLEKSVH